jgi:hypothetical protein
MQARAADPLATQRNLPRIRNLETCDQAQKRRSAEAQKRRSVDLPQPDAPTMAKNSPGAMSIPFTAGLLENDYLKSMSVIDMSVRTFLG